MDASSVIEIENLSISFRTDEGLIEAVKDINLTLKLGTTLGIVGESGSGKSVTTKSLIRLLPGNSQIDPKSTIRYKSKDGRIINIHDLPNRGPAISAIRGGEIAMIFQEPMASFSPVYTIGNQMIEAICLHLKLTRRQARQEAIAMLEKVGISQAATRIDQYPHEMSGGMRQRALIALTLSTQPALLIADEPTTALDVTIQAQVLELMSQLQEDLGMTMIFITHDLAVISQIADEIAVMYLGTIVEQGPTHEVIQNARHPYTRGLLNALPSLDKLEDRLEPVGGDIPSPLDRPKGCPFENRCPMVMARCRNSPPPISQFSEGHQTACWLYDDQVKAENAA